MGQSRHFDRGPAPSGLSRSTDIVRSPRYVGLVPIATNRGNVWDKQRRKGGTALPVPAASVAALVRRFRPGSRTAYPWTDDHAGLAPLELDELGPELDGHHHLFGRGLTLTVDLGPALYGPGVVKVRQQQFLLLQLSDELGPARLDRIVARLRPCNERKRLENWHAGSPLLDEPGRF
jgi:hypothetical protein